MARRSDPLVPLEAILCTEELTRRSSRSPDYATESRALTALVQALADSPRTILQTLADTILKVLDADSSGMSLLAKDKKSFEWIAIAGAWKPHLGGGTPRDFGPCGDVLDCNAPLLFTHWERRYPYLLEAMPLAEEGLLIPFHVEGKAVGTIWAIAHSKRRKFDAEDLRQLESLGRFASGAYQAVELRRSQDGQRAALNLMEDAVQSRQAMEALNRALRESERRFREMIDALPAAIYTTDAEGRITHFNPAAVKLTGRTPELGTDRWCVSWKLYHPDGTPMPHDECPMALALKEGRVIEGAEAILERPDGKRLWFAPYPTPLRDRDGRIVGGINMLGNITERKKAEMATASLAAIVESSDDAIIGKDLNGVITSWNNGAKRLFGYTAQEAIGQSITMLIPFDRQHEESDILARLRRGEHLEHFETVRVRKDGSPLELSLTISPIKDSAGRIIGASKIARDITERKQAEQRQQLLTNELAHRGKNLLAVIQTIISRSLSGKRSLAEAREVLMRRIHALARSQTMLVNGAFEGAPVAEIIRLEFEAFSGRVKAVGPDVMLNPKAAQTFALLAHELATNATKYGALSQPGGRVAITWSIEYEGAEARFKFQWQERDGPPVVPPTRQGFGRILIEKAAAQDFGARPKISYAPEGLSYEIDAPLSAMVVSGGWQFLSHTEGR
jgi:PAS domain S-box-containing protein